MATSSTQNSTGPCLELQPIDESRIRELYEVRPPIPDNFVLGDKEWRPINDVTGHFSYNQLKQVCDLEGDGECSGYIAGKNLTGWTVASIEEVFEMLEQVSGLPSGALADFSEYPSKDQPYATNAIEKIGALHSSNCQDSASGMTRSTRWIGGELRVMQPYVNDNHQCSTWTSTDVFQYSGREVSEEWPYYDFGLYLYRD